jgi:hypothetical protein
VASETVIAVVTVLASFISTVEKKATFEKYKTECMHA